MKIHHLLLAALLVLPAVTSGCKKKAKKPPASDAAKEKAAAAEEKKDVGAVYLLRDNGKRCIVAPCPSWTATVVRTREEVEITGVDVSALDLAGKNEEGARERILAGQVWVRGDLKKVPKAGPGGDGTVLQVTELLEADDPLTKP